MFFFPLCTSWQRSSMNYQSVVSWHQVHPSLACFVVPDLDSNLSLLSWEDAGWTLQKNRKKRLFFPLPVSLISFSYSAAAMGHPGALTLQQVLLPVSAFNFLFLIFSICGPALSRRPIHKLSKEFWNSPLGRGYPFQAYSFLGFCPSALECYLEFSFVPFLYYYKLLSLHIQYSLFKIPV